jgi:hypothetical protein
MRPIAFVYSINGTALERVDEIKDLRVNMDGKMSCLSHIVSRQLSPNHRECCVLLSDFKGFSWPIYSYKTLYTSFVRPNLEYAACVWSPHQSVQSERLQRVQHNFIRYSVLRLPWRVWPLPAYDARCLLIGLEVLSDRRIVASAPFLAGYSGWQGRLCGPCSHRTNYGRFEPVKNAIINFNKYCHWFGFCGAVGRNMFRDRLKSALSGERFGHRRLPWRVSGDIVIRIVCFNPVDQVVL